MLVEKERNQNEQIEEAQWARVEKHVVRGKPYRVGDIVRMMTDSAEVKKMGKNMTRRHSGKYGVIEILGEG